MILCMLVQQNQESQGNLLGEVILLLNLLLNLLFVLRHEGFS